MYNYSKKLLILMSLVSLGSVAQAKNLVTADVPLDSRYYAYVDKLEAMGFITDLTATTRPWSRYDVAKMVAKINPKGMQPYLKGYYDELCEAFSDEIAYVIAHDASPVNITHIPSWQDKEDRYYADQHNWLVGEKVKLAAQSRHFPCNFTLRGASTEVSYHSMDSSSYSYSTLNGSQISATFQPLNSNNNGNRYGEGTNWVTKLHFSGSLCNDVAVGITPRFSLDKEQKGKAFLEEGYVRTHIGQIAITAGRQPLQWGGGSRYSATALSNNATPQTMVRVGLVEPVKIKNGLFKFLGKVNAQVFVSQLDNRLDKANALWYRAGRETNDMKLVGMRAEIQPLDNWSIGFERVSMIRGFNKDWLIGKNAYDHDMWNDIAGFDTLLKFPGLQLYGSIYGEDQAGYMPTKNFYSAGVYFPQLAPDGSWDLRLEAARSDGSCYVHGDFVNGWSYRGDILGEAFGRNATQYQAILSHYLPNSDTIAFQYRHTFWRETASEQPKLQEFILSYDHRLKKNFHLGFALGLAKFANYAGRNDSAKFAMMKLLWDY